MAKMLGLHPYSFSKDILGFLMTTESQDLGLTSHPKDSAIVTIHSGEQGNAETRNFLEITNLTNVGDTETHEDYQTRHRGRETQGLRRLE